VAAASSALTLDPDYEDAAAIQTAIARTADDTKTTLTAFRRWSAIAGKRGRPVTAAERLMLLGHWLRDRGEWSEARRAYEDARAVFEREKHDTDAASALNNIANLELLSGRIQSAIKTYRRSLRTFEAVPDGQADAVIALFNLSLAHKMLGQRDEALQAVEEALAGAQQLKSTALQARCLAQRGAIRDDLGEW
jgi:tetratricopeptide (TPR) repeat protein